jgi:hypothetical protein
MKGLLKKVTGLLALQGMVFFSTAQQSTNNLEIGANIGTYIYQGDLTPSAAGSLKSPGIGLMVFAGKRLTNTFSWRANLAFARLKGNDALYKAPAYRRERNFNFQTRVIELSGLLVWKPMLQGISEYRTPRFIPYLLGGIAVSYVNVKPDWNDFNALYFAEELNVQQGLENDSEHRLPKVLPAVPLGIGVRYSMNSRVSVLAETLYQFTRSDYIDGFSKSANPTRKDSYYSITLGFACKLGRSNFDCPVVSDRRGKF